MNKRKKLTLLSISALVILVGGEIALRELLGMGNAPLYFTECRC